MDKLSIEVRFVIAILGKYHISITVINQTIWINWSEYTIAYIECIESIEFTL